MMEIKEIQNKETWENFLLNCEEKSFLQSWNWGEFCIKNDQRSKIWRLGVFEADELMATALVVKVCARRGTFLSLPHGPIIKNQELRNKKQVYEKILNKLKELAREEGASFIRLSPIEEKNEENLKMFKNLGFRDSPMHLNPDLTWVLDLTPAEDELLQNMRKTTRYLVRQAEKNPNVRIKKSQNMEALETFNEIYKPTFLRQHFVPYSLNYLKNEFLSFLSDDQVLIFEGRYKDEVIASAIIIFWSGIAVYHHGASSLKYPKIPVSYLLQWEAIKEAKRRGCKIYNFWGIVPTRNLKHPWTGFTLFKMGFGGYQKQYVKTQDLILSWRYWINYIIEITRKIKRGL